MQYDVSFARSSLFRCLSMVDGVIGWFVPCGVPLIRSASSRTSVDGFHCHSRCFAFVVSDASHSVTPVTESLILQPLFCNAICLFFNTRRLNDVEPKL